MPRITQALDAEWVEYIPDVGDNRFDDDPMTVEVRPMTVGDFKAFQRQYGPRLNVGAGAAIRHAQKIAEKILRERVRNIVGYVHLGKPVRSGDDLVEFGESEVCDDVFSAIVKISHLQEGLKKKYVSQSDSSRATIHRSDGPAEATDTADG
jgi:hypothetical protein